MKLSLALPISALMISALFSSFSHAQPSAQNTQVVEKYQAKSPKLNRVQIDKLLERPDQL